MGLSKEVLDGAKDYLKTPTSQLDELTERLCSFCQELEKHKPDAIYDGRNSNARSLANWWEQHQKMDKAREKEEQKKKREKEVRKSALSKLTDEERRILGV